MLLKEYKIPFQIGGSGSLCPLNTNYSSLEAPKAV